MIMAYLTQALHNWWLHSTLSHWYSNYLIKKHHIKRELYQLPNKKITLAQLMHRRYNEKPLYSKEYDRPIMMPTGGTVDASSQYRSTISIKLHHYHRIHLPIGGKAHHYMNADGRLCTLQVFSPDGLTITLMIQTRSPNQVLLHYNQKRNYHLPGTEVGIILSPRATITLQSNIPLTLFPKEKTEISCLQVIGTAPTTALYSPTTLKVSTL